MSKRDPHQLALPLYEEDLKRRNQDVLLKNILTQYPMTDEERECLPEGVRLARHVHLAECEECVLAYEDHTEEWKWPKLVCLKDLRRSQHDHRHLPLP